MTIFQKINWRRFNTMSSRCYFSIYLSGIWLKREIDKYFEPRERFLKSKMHKASAILRKQINADIFLNFCKKVKFSCKFCSTRISILVFKFISKNIYHWKSDMSWYFKNRQLLQYFFIFQINIDFYLRCKFNCPIRLWKYKLLTYVTLKLHTSKRGSLLIAAPSIFATFKTRLVIKFNEVVRIFRGIIHLSLIYCHYRSAPIKKKKKKKKRGADALEQRVSKKRSTL